MYTSTVWYLIILVSLVSVLVFTIWRFRKYVKSELQKKYFLSSYRPVPGTVTKRNKLRDVYLGCMLRGYSIIQSTRGFTFAAVIKANNTGSHETLDIVHWDHLGRLVIQEFKRRGVDGRTLEYYYDKYGRLNQVITTEHLKNGKFRVLANTEYRYSGEPPLNNYQKIIRE